MNESENLHAGHRERMIKKFISDPKAMPEHELLEILLFSAIPRKDTNVTAHRLLRAFGDIYGVLCASPEELAAVSGLGVRTAAKLSLFGQIIKRIISEYPKKKPAACYSFASFREQIIEQFDGLDTEKFVIFLFDAKKWLITSMSFDDRNRHQVTADIPEIAQAFALHKPAFALIAHNHTSGSPEPSETDDFTTAKLHLLCSVHGVTLMDHIIVCKNDAVSYFLEGKLEEIVKAYNLEKLLKKGKEN